MKIRLFLLSILAICTLASCSKEKENNNEDNTPKKAYLAISIKAPAAATRATPSEEADLTRLDIICYGEGNNILGIVPITNNINAGAATEAVEVNTATKKIFVIANANSAIQSTINAVTTNHTALIETLIETVDYDNTNEFLMSSGAQVLADATSVKNDEGLKDVTLTLTSDGKTEAQTKSDAQASAKAVLIDRFAAKATVKAWKKDGTDQGAPNAAHAELTGWVLNTTNKGANPYTKFVSAEVNNSKVTKGYRQDHNYNGVIVNLASSGTLIDQFSHYNNEGSTGLSNTAITWLVLGTDVDYCLENTMAVAAAQNAQTTKILFKGTYVPSNGLVGSFNSTTSYFRVITNTSTKYYDLAEFKTFIATKKGENGSTAKDADNTYIDNLESKTSAIDTRNFEAGDSYKYATVAPGNDATFRVSYYHKAVCYYALNMQHDTEITVGNVSRYGVVRNNSYTINIKNITQEGTSYIPDPTDEDIVDPGNPKPGDLNDPAKGFISVKITVNDWITSSQDSDLSK